MNTKDEILDVMDGHFKGPLPPPVILTQTGTVEMMDACGVYWPEANYDAEKMAKLSLQPHELFGLATARVPYDVVAQAESIGCSIFRGGQDSQPSVCGSPWRGSGIGLPPFPDDLPSAREALEHPSLRTIIDAADRLHSRGDLFVTSMCIAGGGLVMHMLGLENMIMSMMMDQDGVLKWVHKMAGYSATYARELSSVSDNVCVITDVMSDVMSPEIATKMSYEDKIIIHSIEGAFSMIHNCGNTLHNVDDIISMGSDIVSLEMSPKPKEYMAKIDGRCKVLGCINPVEIMLDSDADTVRQKALFSAELGVDFVGPECGLPPLTPNENVAALANYRL
ncbi:MAG: hypothetical protein J6T68_05065 [Candidatus Methanomethylophilaceae archaeon]|nr:hypothetical protein [Candidatus Methanomethylophilaceae archaeon]